METNNEFLPKDYELPSSGGAYFKPKQGDNKVRILTSPVIGWVDWDKSDPQNPKPLRFAMSEKPTQALDKIKHFWAVVVWSYSANQIQVWEITQSSIQDAIKNLSSDSDWGTPLEYDLNINRTGESLETSYLVNPKPKTPVTQEIIDDFTKTPVNLIALFNGEDPFDPTSLQF